MVEPACHICGKTPEDQVTLWPIHSPPGELTIWACEKHLDRLPCMAPFCRRTYKWERGAGYYQVICGKHWRLAPEYMRKAYTRVLRAGNRYGWSDAMRARRNRIFQRTASAAIDVILSGGGDG